MHPIGTRPRVIQIIRAQINPGGIDFRVKLADETTTWVRDVAAKEYPGVPALIARWRKTAILTREQALMLKTHSFYHGEEGKWLMPFIH
jgi:hypothetical protein